jgi:tRNA U34 5-methylaminomethyl-2-thiouridine-forming methyltransferase MnmC
MSSDYQIVRLANGVHSIRSNAEGETFHPVVGPVEEARALYVEQLRLPERIAAAKREFVIWDIGLGAAANVLTLLESSRGNETRIRILSFDHTLKPLEFAVGHAEDLEYPLPFVDELDELIAKQRVSFERNGMNIDWDVQVADFPSLLATPLAERWAKPDAILFDAFSPAKNPAMWTLPLFRRIFELLDPQRPCAMPTYSRSTMLRVTLLLAGFFVGVGRAIAEKEETTIAANDLALIEQPLGADWLKRAKNSTCAEPLIDAAYRRERLSEGSWTALQRHPQFAGLGAHKISSALPRE